MYTEILGTAGVNPIFMKHIIFICIVIFIACQGRVYALWSVVCAVVAIRLYYTNRFSNILKTVGKILAEQVDVC